MARFPRPVSDVVLRPRVRIANRTEGGVLFWTGKLYGYAFLSLGFLTILIATLAGRSVAGSTPRTPDFRGYARQSPAITRMYAADGTLMGEFAKEWREVTPYERMPPTLVEAFIAIEDHDFWNHGGIYYKGIARAVWANLTAGDFAQGGSTITQQVAKQFLVDDKGHVDKSLLRKGKEAIMARRLEARYSKRAILSVYLNHIYLGAGAWGVAAAAERYFQKRLDQLTLSESALIAGLAKAPSLYSPARDLDRAIERRNLVLDRMQLHGYATAAEVAAAKAEPVTLKLYREVFPDRMPYYAEHVRRYVAQSPRYGQDALMTGGLQIETAVEPTFDAGAYGNVDYGTHKQDKRQGWRGPEWHVDGPAAEMFVERQKQRYGTGPLEPGRRYLALVDTVTGGNAQVIVGDRTLQLPLRNAKWASKWESGNAVNDIEVDSLTRVLHKGDVIWVSREIRTRDKYREWYMPDGHNPSWRVREDNREWDAKNQDVVQLEQVPHPQGAIFTADHRTGYVAAMVGGYDYDRSVFNRTVQACRQPGSTYKPIYYSLALEEGYGFDTILNDVPVKIVDPVTGIEWTPENLNDTLDGDVTLEYAMVFSKNIPSVDIFKRLGAQQVEQWARKLGYTTKIIPDDALALGASCARMDEMTRAFSVFARDGLWYPRPAPGPGTDAVSNKDWIYVRRVLDRDGNAIEDNTVPFDPELAAADRFDRIQARAGIEAERAIPARTAFLMNKLLAQAIRYGFSKTLRNTEIETAGKTGTSSDTHDTWFIAYTSRFISTTWLGDDKKERALGRSDAAFVTVEPLWARYMYEIVRGFPNPEIPWSVPDGVNPKDRGAHTKGERGSMSLIYRHAEKPPEAGSLDI
jgi:penicillin-binding protein 1A